MAQLNSSLNIDTVGKGQKTLERPACRLKAELMPSGFVVFLFTQFVLKKASGW